MAQLVDTTIDGNLDVNGDISVSGNVAFENGLINFIEDQGSTEDGWIYIKYANGWAEMWFRGDIGQVTLSTVLGTDIVSNPFSINFPFSFTEIPYCVVNYEGNSTGYAGVQMVNANATTESKSYGIRLVRIGTSSIALQNNMVSCYARGKWK